MTKGNFKRLAALLVSATMLVGSSLTVFADGTDGTGSYEGGEMKYPVLSVTLPTVPAGTYNYIADPNGLIAMTSAAAYDGATFTGTSGVFFKTTDAEGETKATYTNTSKALELKNENAQDIDVTIKLEQKAAGSEGIAYSDTATFEETDKDQKIYLAVKDGASTPNTAALSATKAATLTTKVEGKKSNYKPSWDETNKYGYVLDDTKKDGTTNDYVWNSCSYALTGALNTNAEWGDAVTFPTITVTWNYAEHVDTAAPSVTTATLDYSKANGAEISGISLGVGDAKATGIAGFGITGTDDKTGTVNDITNATQYWSYEDGTITMASGMWGSAAVDSKRWVKITFDDSANTVAWVECTIKE